MLAGRGFRPSQFMQSNFKLALIMEWHRLWCSFMTGLGLMWFFSLNRRLIFNAQPCLWCWLAGCVVWPHSAVIPVLFSGSTVQGESVLTQGINMTITVSVGSVAVQPLLPVCTFSLLSVSLPAASRFMLIRFSGACNTKTLMMENLDNGEVPRLRWEEETVTIKSLWRDY